VFKRDLNESNVMADLVLVVAELLQLWDDVHGAAAGGLGSGVP